MKILIRTDASTQIGTGHVLRNLALAQELRRNGNQVTFVSRELQGHLCTLVHKSGFDVLQISSSITDWKQDLQETAEVLRNQKFDWVIVDHYDLDAQWETAIRNHVERLMVIDDLADRQHACDVLLDQNFCLNFKNRYVGKVPSNNTLLLGPQYALLRREFSETRDRSEKRQGHLKRLLVFFGGADAFNQTTFALKAIGGLGADLDVDVIVGPSNPHKTSIMDQAKKLKNSQVHCDPSNVAELMAQADLCVGAGGVAIWERSCLGLPSIVTTVAENQIPAAQHMHNEGYHLYLGHHAEVSEEALSKALKNVIEDFNPVFETGKRSMDLVDGRGAQRVAETLLRAKK